MIGFELPDEIRDVQKLARDFARNELRPAEEAIDRITDPAEAFQSQEFKKIVARLYEMGFHKLTFPEEVGGLGLPQFASYVVLEELAAGGPGLASHILVAPLGGHIINMFGLGARMPEYQQYAQEFFADTTGERSGCWAITEPQVGSDIFTFDRNATHFHTRAAEQGSPPAGVTATKDGKGYRIDGAKSAFVSNGHLADMILLMTSGDAAQGMNGTATFLVPGDLPGITRGKPLDKLGLRALNQSEIFFDDVWVPEEMLVAPPGPMYKFLLDTIVTLGNTSVGLLAVGTAQAAYDAALAHAKERAQAGSRIFDYQLVRMKLWDAHRSIEASRLMLWKSAWLLSEGRPSVQQAMAARTLASDMATRVCSEMVQVFGGYGISKEYPVEKCYRDAKLLQIMDGTVERVSMFASADL